MSDVALDRSDGDRSSRRDIRDVRSLRAFAHPLRVRLYYELGLAEAATATYLSQQTEEAVALVSYHLHQLAAHGFIVPAPERARDGREHWWKLSERRLSWHDADLGDTMAGREIATTVKHSMVREQYRQIQRYLSAGREWDSAWTDAAFHDDGTVSLTAAELAEMHRELTEIMKRYKRRSTEDSTTPRERVLVILHGFPYDA